MVCSANQGQNTKPPTHQAYEGISWFALLLCMVSCRRGQAALGAWRPYPARGGWLGRLLLNGLDCVGDAWVPGARNDGPGAELASTAEEVGRRCPCRWRIRRRPDQSDCPAVHMSSSSDQGRSRFFRACGREPRPTWISGQEQESVPVSLHLS